MATEKRELFSRASGEYPSYNFCTSGGSGLSDTEKIIQALEPSATLVKGLHVSGSASKDATSDVKEWINEIK